MIYQSVLIATLFSFQFTTNAWSTLVLNTTGQPPLDTKTQDGFMDDVAREALKSINYELVIDRLPAERGLRNANNGLIDGEMIREIITGMLQGHGYLIETADEGKQAIEMYKESMDAGKPFDCVIMDLTIPGGIGGKEAIKGILKLDPKAKAIISSGYVDDLVMANYADYGFKGIVVKPYTMHQLLDLLRRILSE